MDAQLKRGLLETCVLAVLSTGDSYGYEIVKDMPEYVGLSESTLYPILKRLVSADMLTFYSVEHNGRLRKYYKITDNGHKRINEFIDEWDEVMKVYNFIISKKEETASE